MLILQILGAITAAIALFWTLTWFNSHCNRKFGYKFLATKPFVASMAAALLIGGGHAWYQSSLKGGGDTLNGIILMIIGGIVGTVLVAYNFRRTNALYGLGGTILQIGIFAMVGSIAIGIFLPFGLCYLLAGDGVKSVRVVD